ncbi:hypothetical protein [Marinobacterium jannaschii]|uniref:hypothetical protein n=1 Tax=Marinobacterium jannaschii TaxID=64970 RepID=UPI0004818CFF|nr:hypothetical protein [Marinobacterium jannaschii]
MQIAEYMSLIILAITIMTLMFGVVAYFLYKVREKRKKSRKTVSYEQILEEMGTDYIFFEK